MSASASPEQLERCHSVCCVAFVNVTPGWLSSSSCLSSGGPHLGGGTTPSASCSLTLRPACRSRTASLVPFPSSPSWAFHCQVLRSPLGHTSPMPCPSTTSPGRSQLSCRAPSSNLTPVQSTQRGGRAPLATHATSAVVHPPFASLTLHDVHAYTHTHNHTHERTHNPTCTTTHVCTQAHIQPPTQPHTCAHAHTQPHTRTHTTIHAHAHTCAHTHAHSHTGLSLDRENDEPAPFVSTWMGLQVLH